MKKIILILIITHCSILIVKAQWIKQFSPNHDLYDIEFINRNTGWTCGDNFIYKTTDGGITWNEQSHPIVSRIMQIFPVNENVVYAVGLWNFLKTTDGGENWTAIFAGGAGQGLPDLEGLYFINENTGWLVGNIVAMKTTNGGMSFVDSMRVEAIAQDVYFKDSLNGIFCSYSGGFSKTTNGGKNWNRIQIIHKGPLYNFYRIAVFNDSLVWVGSRPVYRSTDFGNTWDSISYYPFPEFGDYVYNISFSSAMTGYAGGASRNLFKTTDGGYNWILQQTSQFLPGLYLGMFAYNDSTVWACGRRIILKTETGGLAGISNFSLDQPHDYKLYQNYPNPFNPTTIIRYKLITVGYIKLNVFNISGKLVANLVNKKQMVGEHTVEFIRKGLSSGVYVYTLEAFDDRNKKLFIESKKMLIIK